MVSECCQVKCQSKSTTA